MSNGKDKISGELQGAIAQLRTDLSKVEIWASALSVFSAPVLDYDIEAQRKRLPNALESAPRAEGRDRNSVEFVRGASSETTTKVE